MEGDGEGYAFITRIYYFLFASTHLRALTNASIHGVIWSFHIYEEALRMNGVSAAEVVMIGDSWNSDIQGAINAGIDQIWIRKSKDPLPEGQSATYLVHTLSDVMEIL